jgi:hypothetical protein
MEVLIPNTVCPSLWCVLVCLRLSSLGPGGSLLLSGKVANKFGDRYRYDGSIIGPADAPNCYSIESELYIPNSSS